MIPPNGGWIGRHNLTSKLWLNCDRAEHCIHMYWVGYWLQQVWAAYIYSRRPNLGLHLNVQHLRCEHIVFRFVPPTVCRHSCFVFCLNQETSPSFCTHPLTMNRRCLSNNVEYQLVSRILSASTFCWLLLLPWSTCMVTPVTTYRGIRTRHVIELHS